MFGLLSPIVGGVLVDTLLDSQGKLFVRTFGSLVEIRVTVKKSAYEDGNFQGVGFYYRNDASDLNNVVLKSELAQVGDPVTLKDGSTARVYGFLMAMPYEFGRSKYGWEISNVKFKPFAMYIDRKVWDYHLNNFTVFRTDQPTYGYKSSIDLQREILK